MVLEPLVCASGSSFSVFSRNLTLFFVIFSVIHPPTHSVSLSHRFSSWYHFFVLFCHLSFSSPSPYTLPLHSIFLLSCAITGCSSVPCSVGSQVLLPLLFSETFPPLSSVHFQVKSPVAQRLGRLVAFHSLPVTHTHITDLLHYFQKPKMLLAI